MAETAKLSQIMNQEVANLTVLYTKLHNFHWYVKGPQFFVLHEKFEELYNEMTEHMDVIAERMLAIGSNPISTLKEVLDVATIKEAKGTEKAEDMVQALVDDFKLLISELTAGIEEAENIGDEATGDIFIGIVESLEKHNWMLRAFLQ